MNDKELIDAIIQQLQERAKMFGQRLPYTYLPDDARLRAQERDLGCYLEDTNMLAWISANRTD